MRDYAKELLQYSKNANVATFCESIFYSISQLLQYLKSNYFTQNSFFPPLLLCPKL